MNEESGDGTPARADDPGYGQVARAVTARDAAAFVHVGDRFDDDMRYLTRFGGPDRSYAFVLVPDASPVAASERADPGAVPSDWQTTLCAPSLFGEQARREFPGDSVRTDRVGEPAGERAAAVLTAADVSGAVLVPASIPHEAVARLEAAGYEVTATEAVSEARRMKPPSQIARHRTVQRAATAGMAAAESALAAADTRDGRVIVDGEGLTTERLRRIVNSVLAERGVEPAGNTVIGAGPTAADLHFTGDDAIRAGETVLLDLSPRGPSGAYADITRTFAVESSGGWERRAYIAVSDAREAALAHVAAGVPAGTVHEEAAAEIAAHGFRVDSSEQGFTHSVGHGVGFSLHEPPAMGGDDPLRVGDVVTIEPGVYDPDRGGVRLEDTVVVRDEGAEILAGYPFGLTPSARDADSVGETELIDADAGGTTDDSED